MRIVSFILIQVGAWWRDNTAPTFIDKGFYSKQAEDDFVAKTNEVLKWCLTAPNLATVETIEKYFERYLHYSNFPKITTFLIDMNMLCQQAIADAKIRLGEPFIDAIILKACQVTEQSKN